MQRYYERLDPGNEPLVSEHLLALAVAGPGRGQPAGAGPGGRAARLDHLKQYQHYVRLRWDYDRTPDKDRKRELALAILTHVYRTRYTYMNHWEAIRQAWTPAAGQGPRRTRLVRTQRRRTAVEGRTTAGSRRDGKGVPGGPGILPAAEPGRTEFTADLVPAGFKSDEPADPHQQYQEGTRYALSSAAG